MNKNTITMYKPFKIAQDFTVQYFGICIPKNAIYGRLTKNIYIFVDDFRQFRPNMHNCTISIHLLDIRKDSKFKKYIVKDSNIIFKLCYDFIAKNKLWDTICENNLCYRKSGVRPSWYVAPRRPSQRAFKDPSRFIGINDDMKFKELTVSAHYQYETASMVGVSIRDAKRVDVDLNEITRRYSK